MPFVVFRDGHYLAIIDGEFAFAHKQAHVFASFDEFDSVPDELIDETCVIFYLKS